MDVWLESIPTVNRSCSLFLVTKGGVINMSNGEDPEDGPVAILRNSTFMYNQASLDNGGVVNVGSYGLLLVAGDDSVFAFNQVTRSGGVFAATTDTTIVIEGGEFHDNAAEKARSKQ